MSERANRSIQQLSGGAVEHLHPDGEEVQEVRGSDGSLFCTMAEEEEEEATAAWSQKTQSEAGESVISCGLKGGSVLLEQHLEISLCVILLTDSTQSCNNILLVCLSGLKLIN